jgi:hypothetical protein
MLAADYDWMLNDGELANGRAVNHPAVARLLQRVSRASVILDAACHPGFPTCRVGWRRPGPAGKHTP